MSDVAPGDPRQRHPKLHDMHELDDETEWIDGEEGNNDRSLLRLWFCVLLSVILLLATLSAIAVHRSNARNEDEQDVQRGRRPCSAAPHVRGDRRKDKNVLSIANFNAEWLFLEGGTGSIECPSESCPWATQAEARQHLQRVARVIEELDADIVNLNEVESCYVLDELVRLLPKDHGYRYYLVPSHDHATGQNPAILTRVDPLVSLKHTKQTVDFPLEGSRCSPDFTGRHGSSKHYVTRFAVGNERGAVTAFVMAGIHFLARPLDPYRCGRREAQARVVETLIQQHLRQDDRVIIAGDFNDFDNEVLGASGERSITMAVGLLKKGLSLANTAGSIPRSLRYSCWFDKDQNCADNGTEEHCLIDHVLASGGWKILDASFHHGYRVSCQDRVSDHWPFKVTFDLS